MEKKRKIPWLYIGLLCGVAIIYMIIPSPSDFIRALLGAIVVFCLIILSI